VWQLSNGYNVTQFAAPTRGTGKIRSASARSDDDDSTASPVVVSMMICGGFLLLVVGYYCYQRVGEKQKVSPHQISDHVATEDAAAEEIKLPPLGSTQRRDSV